jgi:penicillin G amidase
MPSGLAARLGLLTTSLWHRLSGRPWPARGARGRREVAGLGAAVQISRDSWGIPHIAAETSHDLGVGIGWAMAEDRLWQMDLTRRLASGRLAELLGDRPIGDGGLHVPGPTVLAADVWYRQLGLREGARAEHALLGLEARERLAGFARGVNAYLAACRPRDLPLECVLAGCAPEPWTSEDSLLIGKLMGWVLSLSFPAKPILARLGTDPALAPFVPPDLATGHCIVGGPLPGATATADLTLRRALGLAETGAGSNCWAVAGWRTASGKPILCNDPHLSLGLPSLWYPLAIAGAGQSAVGGTFPGVPAVLVGRSARLAWGLTALMADDGDYYRETLDASGGRYRRGDEWHDVETAEEAFRVRGRREDVRRRLAYVRHGGVRCPLLAEPGMGGPVSFRWAGFEPGRGLEAFLGMNRAADLAEFEAALRHLAVPAQNVLAADAAGRIAYFCAGSLPRRAPGAAGRSALDGSRPEDAWQGYLDWAERPRVVDPPEGYLVTANNRAAPLLHPSLAAGFWEPPYRAARIVARLSGETHATAETMQALQADTYSVQAAGLVAGLVHPAAAALREADACRAARLLSAWDGRMTADSGAATLYALFYQALLTQAVRPLLDRHAAGLSAGYLGLLHLAVPAVDAALLAGQPALFPAGAAAAVEACLGAAWQEAVRRLGPDPAGWRWGRLHTLGLAHPLGRGTSRLARGLAWLWRLRRGPFPQAGDGFTVRLGAFPLTAPFAVRVGQSYRQIVDLGEPDAARFILAGGVSGDPRSPHFADQLDVWLKGGGVPMRLASEASGGHGLLLAPPSGGDCAAPACML